MRETLEILGLAALQFIFIIAVGVITIALCLILEKVRGRERRLSEASAVPPTLAEIFRRESGQPLELLLDERRRFGIYEGHLASGRAARVEARGDGSLRVELAAPRSLHVSVRKKSWLEGMLGIRARTELGDCVLASADRDLAKRAFEERSGLQRVIEDAFEKLGLEQLLIWDGKLVARGKRAVSPRWRAELGRLEQIAAAFDPVPLAVRVLGGERKALRGSGGKPRCALCHDSITGDEPDLVACDRCQTVLHDACWRELDRCPVLGCGGRVPERAREPRLERVASEP